MQLNIYTYKYNLKHVYDVGNTSYQYKYMYTYTWTGCSHNMRWMIFSINSSWGQKFTNFVSFRLKYKRERWNTSHQTGKPEHQFFKCVGKGYVSSQEPNKFSPPQKRYGCMADPPSFITSRYTWHLCVIRQCTGHLQLWRVTWDKDG